MATLRCASCGASIAIEGVQSLIRCEYCKSVSLVDRIADQTGDLRSNLALRSRRIDPIFESAANYLHDDTADGGRLYVTRSEFVFVPHAFNLTSGYRLVIPFSDLCDIQKVNQLVFMRKLVLVLRDGQCVEFVVWHRDKIIDAVRKHL